MLARAASLEIGNFTVSLIGAVASVGVFVFAVHQFNAARKEARARATFDFFLGTSSDPKFLEHRDKFVEICGDDQNFHDIAKDGSCEKHTAILYMLNHYELAARGMLNGALDEKFFKAHLRKSFLRHWEAIRPFAVALRTKFNNPLIGQAADHIFEKWK